MKQGRVLAGAAVAVAVAAGAVGGALIGIPGLSGAQQFATVATTTNNAAPAATGSAPMPPPHDSAMLDAAAKALGLTTDQLRQRLSDGKTTIADVAKEKNVPLKDVEDAMDAVARDKIDKIVNSPWPQHPDFPGGAPFAGPGGPGKWAMGPRGLIGEGLDAVAKALGITTDQLKTDLAKGQSIADIAKSKNINVDQLIQTLTDEANAKVDQAVKDKKLTTEQGTAIKSHTKEAITAFVNGTLPKFPGGDGGKFRGHFGFGGPPGAPPMPGIGG